TYGKPVGFFPITIFDADLYAVSFKTQNAEAESDYFSGMEVDKNISEDVRKNWGDEDEAMLAQALQYAGTGQFSSNLALQSSRNPRVPVSVRTQAFNRKLNQHNLHDMIDFRKRIQLDRFNTDRIRVK